MPKYTKKVDAIKLSDVHTNDGYMMNKSENWLDDAIKNGVITLNENLTAILHAFSAKFSINTDDYIVRHDNGKIESINESIFKENYKMCGHG